MPADFPYLSADLLPGLLDSWDGPGVIHDGEDWASIVIAGSWAGAPAGMVRAFDGGGSEAVRTNIICLDLRNRWVQHLVRDYLEAGVRCPNCTGLGRVSQGGGGPFPCLRCGGADDGCAMHDGSGYRIPPSALRWTLDISPWEAAVVLWLSAVRVAAGMGAIRGILVIGDLDADDERLIARVLSRGTVIRDGPTLRGMGPEGVVTFTEPETTG